MNPSTNPVFTDIDLPLPDRREGKVRVSFALPDGHRLFVTTDRLSAFDRVVAAVPYKGQVLNQLAAWWFAHTGDIVANHVLAVPDPNALVALDATPLPVEVVVRGYITGVTTTSLWHFYSRGDRDIYGHQFRDGLAKNTVLDHAIVTPTTKAERGEHDEPLSCSAVVERGLLDRHLWDHIQEVALSLYDRGAKIAASAGLILADTKYEFGLDRGGNLLLIDELHTPDSSRYWVAANYEERLAAGQEPESLDKEIVRRAYADAGYRGDGDPPSLAPAVWTEASARYIQAYETITATPFERGSYPVESRVAANLSEASIL